MFGLFYIIGSTRKDILDRPHSVYRTLDDAMTFLKEDWENRHAMYEIVEVDPEKFKLWLEPPKSNILPTDPLVSRSAVLANEIYKLENKDLDLFERMDLLEKKVEFESIKFEWESEEAEAEFLVSQRKKIKDFYDFGVCMGWWIIAADGEPMGVKTFKLSDFDERALLAHVMAKAEMFKSVSEARKNGWNKPITKGDFLFKKRRYIIRIV